MSATAVRTPSRLGGSPPDRSLAQRLDALQRANEIRSHRGNVKRDLAAGRATVAATLEDPIFATAKVYDVLVALPKVGRVKASKALTSCRIAHSKTCAGLTPRQREALLDELSKRGIR